MYGRANTFFAKNNFGFSSVFLLIYLFRTNIINRCKSNYFLMSFFLKLFDKRPENIAVHVENSCSVHKSNVHLLKVNFVSCASHRFNVTGKEIIFVQAVLVVSVQALLTKVTHYVFRAAL